MRIRILLLLHNDSRKNQSPRVQRGVVLQMGIEVQPDKRLDRMVEVTADQCDHCGSTNLEECGVEKQVIREHGLMRKIIGTFRSENGAEYYQYIASIFATWWLQGKDVYAELKKLLVNELCLK